MPQANVLSYDKSTDLLIRSSTDTRTGNPKFVHQERHRFKLSRRIVFFRGPLLFTICSFVFIILPLVEFFGYEIIGIFVAFAVSIVLCCYDLTQLLYATIDNERIQSSIHLMRVVADQTSLDDFLRAIYDPLSGCVFPFIGAVLGPFSMYAAPFMTQEQRATLFESTMMPQLSENTECLRSIFIEPGKWINLLPKSIQFLLKLDNEGSKRSLCDAVSVTSTVNSESSYIANEFREDSPDSSVFNSEMIVTEDSLARETPKESSQHKIGANNMVSTTPIDIADNHKIVKVQNFEEQRSEAISKNYPGKVKHDRNDENITHLPEKLQSDVQRRPPHELWQSFMVENVVERIRSFTSHYVASNSERICRTATLSAVTSSVVLMGQLRYSKTARQNILRLFHLATTVTTVSSLAVSTGILLLLLTSVNDQKSGSNNDSNVPGQEDSMAAAEDTIGLPVSSSTTANQKSSVANSSTEQRGLVWYENKKLTSLLHDLFFKRIGSSLELKGLLAAFVLYYFGQRHRNRKTRQGKWL